MGQVSMRRTKCRPGALGPWPEFLGMSIATASEWRASSFLVSSLLFVKGEMMSGRLELCYSSSIILYRPPTTCFWNCWINVHTNVF